MAFQPIQRIPLEKLIAAIESQEYIGFCLYCGTEVSDVEPDARGYVCPSCDTNGVYGVEEILLMQEG